MRHIKAKWTPTPIAATHAPIVIGVPAPPSWRRSWQIGRAAAGRICGLVLRHRSPAVIGQHVRQQCETLGGLWIKVGQLLSLRVDLFPAAFCAALTSLQGRVEGFPAGQARAILEQQLGRPVADVFVEFDAVPVAVASLGQVHRARLRHEQTVVAVKVRRPFAVDAFLSDLAILAVLARLTSWLVPRYRLAEGVDELRRIVIEELDFRFEANAQRRMRRSLRPHGLHVPKLYAAYSTDQVLVSEWVDGVLMGDYLDLLTSDPDAADTWARANGIRPKRIARRLILSMFRQIFEDNRFHGDMHPRNILLLRDSRIVLLDFGTTSQTERQFLATFRHQIEDIATGEYQTAAELTNLLTAALPAKTWWITKIRHATRMDALTAALVRALEAWSVRAEIATLDYHQKSINACTTALMTTVLQHGGSMQWAWMRIQRAMSTLDGSLPLLDPTVNYRKVVRRYLREAAARVPACAPLDALAGLIREFPAFAQILRRVPERWRLEISRLRQLESPLQGL
jgi:ubiquinone biosynthesis protein